MQAPNTFEYQIPQPNNTMVRLSNIAGKAFRRAREQASAQPVTQFRTSEVVGKPVYMYVIQKFPERHIDPAHSTGNAALLQLNTPTIILIESS